MTRVRVKAVEGRIARESPRGEFIPSDKFVAVKMTPYIRRLIEVWGDLEVESVDPVVSAVPKSKPLPPVKEETTNGN